jgi:hypothetical protein
MSDDDFSAPIRTEVMCLVAARRWRGRSKVGIQLMVVWQQCSNVGWLSISHVADFGMIFLDDGNSGEKSLQRDAIVGRWDGHTLNLGGVGRMAAEHRSVVVAADVAACEMRGRRQN